MKAQPSTGLKLTVTLGLGLLPGAPGTYGSALVAGLAAVWLAIGRPAFEGPWYLGFVALLTGFALWSCRMVLKMGIFGDDKDPSPIVIDEAVGMAIAMYGVSAIDWRLPAAFIAFRFFDILKPFPVGWSQKLPGEWGIVVDDVLAGVYALISVRLMEYALFKWAPAALGG